MKYLNTFESNIVSQPDLYKSNKFKKYIIIKSDRNAVLFYILMNIEEKDDDNTTIKYGGFSFYYNYGYEDNGKELNIINQSGNITILKYQILYQTDDFDDAVKMLNIIRTSDKYNL